MTDDLPPIGADVLAVQRRRARRSRRLRCAAARSPRRLGLPLPFRETRVPVGTDRPVFEFDGQRAFFVSFELPPFAAPYSVLVESQAADAPLTFEKTGGVLGVSAVTARTLMAPAMATLDAEFRTLHLFDASTLRPRGESLEQTVFVNAGNATERHLVRWVWTVGKP